MYVWLRVFFVNVFCIGGILGASPCIHFNMTNIAQPPWTTKFDFESRGPFGVHGTYMQYNGAVNQMLLGNNGTAFAASVGGGVWRTQNLGVETPVWTQVTPNTCQKISVMAQDDQKREPPIICFACGDRSSSGSSLEQRGSPYCSFDSGASWNSTLQVASANYGRIFTALHVRWPAVTFGTTRGLYTGSAAPGSVQIRYQQILPGGVYNYLVSADSKHIFVVRDDPHTPVMKLSTASGWVPVALPVSKLSLKYSSLSVGARPQLFLLSYNSTFLQVDCETLSARVINMPTSVTLFPGAQQYYHGAMHATAHSVYLAGDSFQSYPSYRTPLYRYNWNNDEFIELYGRNELIHPDSRHLTTDGEKLYICGDGGIYLFDDYHVSFKSQTVAAGEVYSAALVSENILIAGLQDNGVAQIDPTGAASALSFADGVKVAVGVGGGDAFFCLQYGICFHAWFSAWTRTRRQVLLPLPVQEFLINLVSNVVQRDRVAFFTSGGLFESCDAGHTWYSTRFPRYNGRSHYAQFIYGGRIGDVVLPDLFVAGNTDGGLLVRNGNNSLIFDSNQRLCQGGIYNLVASPCNSSQMYAAIGSPLNVFQLDVDLMGTNRFSLRQLPPLPESGNSLRRRYSRYAFPMCVIPGKSNVVLIAQNFAIYRWTMGDSQWEMIWNIYGVQISELSYSLDRDVLVVSTMGRGVWTLTDVSKKLTGVEPMCKSVSVDYSGQCPGTRTAMPNLFQLVAIVLGVGFAVSVLAASLGMCCCVPRDSAIGWTWVFGGILPFSILSCILSLIRSSKNDSIVILCLVEMFILVMAAISFAFSADFLASWVIFSAYCWVAVYVVGSIRMCTLFGCCCSRRYCRRCPASRSTSQETLEMDHLDFSAASESVRHTSWWPVALGNLLTLCSLGVMVTMSFIVTNQGASANAPNYAPPVLTTVACLLAIPAAIMADRVSTYNASSSMMVLRLIGWLSATATLTVGLGPLISIYLFDGVISPAIVGMIYFFLSMQLLSFSGNALKIKFATRKKT